MGLGIAQPSSPPLGDRLGTGSYHPGLADCPAHLLLHFCALPFSHLPGPVGPRGVQNRISASERKLLLVSEPPQRLFHLIINGSRDMEPLLQPEANGHQQEVDRAPPGKH